MKNIMRVIEYNLVKNIGDVKRNFERITFSFLKLFKHLLLKMKEIFRGCVRLEIGYVYSLKNVIHSLKNEKKDNNSMELNGI